MTQLSHHVETLSPHLEGLLLQHCPVEGPAQVSLLPTPRPHSGS